MHIRGLQHTCIMAIFMIYAIICKAQRNVIYNSRIASLQVMVGNNWLVPPITNLNDLAKTPINISFDDMTHEYHRYTYSIEHCEADWKTSENLFASDYIEGFSEGNTIDNIAQSVNTNQLYTHYSLSIPNERCAIRMSGNYRLTVYDDNNHQEPVLSACFWIVEPIAGISLSVSTNTDIDINNSHQQVSMNLNYGPLNVTDPQNQIQTVVMQNGRWDNAVINSKPQYITNDGLRWSHNRDLIFAGGNEYRKFETLDVNHPTMGIETIDWDGSNYHAYVWTDEPRLSYIYDEDANGAFCIRNSDNVENNTASDYLIVHFRLKTPHQTGDIYLNGAWTNDRFLPQYKMQYNDTQGCYEAAVKLKQGYYSYQYLLMKPDHTLVPVPSEGNFYQTENRYQALVYFKGIGERTDRLVGYNSIRIK
ncbi:MULTISPECIES: type IX secretion system plug protein [Prevotellaceae]|uniref:type IX secretion system plug protein n=1 Tax=Hoylesella oralis TaxID=28134 RepID=UPI00035401DD|nr:hypothetical protein HMPREF1475_00415 [Hoylesella oralis HGA0225]ETD21400.1 hypothetical protein HMPREF1199_00470 [Hoylesella oralis CC98A]SHF62187.1 protein of unknown function [Hoylesella oralis]